MADYRIATEKEAANIGGGTSYTDKLAVTKIRAEALGCTIRLTSYTDYLLVALKDLLKTEVESCECNGSECYCYGYNSGTNCYIVNNDCSCNTGQCDCYGYSESCYWYCYPHSECSCNAGVCYEDGASEGCSGKCEPHTDCECNSGVCDCDGHVEGCYKECSPHNSCYVCPYDTSFCTCDNDCGMDIQCIDEFCKPDCHSNKEFGCDLCPEACSCNSGICDCDGYVEGCSGECKPHTDCECNSGVCDGDGATGGSGICDPHSECTCNSGVCYDGGSEGKPNYCYSQESCIGYTSCDCYGYTPATCTEYCYPHNGCKCNTICTIDCSTNYG